MLREHPVAIVKYIEHEEEIEIVAITEDSKTIMQCTSEYIEDAGYPQPA